MTDPFKLEEDFAPHMGECAVDEHNFCPPIQMHYVDGDAKYPYAVTTCSKCGFTRKFKISFQKYL
jgi:hypothetical protein